MKKRIISLLCGLLATACSPDLHDENSVLENNRQQAEMSVEVQVSGTMISTRSAASAEERAVTSYDNHAPPVSTFPEGHLMYLYFVSRMSSPGKVLRVASN